MRFRSPIRSALLLTLVPVKSGCFAVEDLLLEDKERPGFAPGDLTLIASDDAFTPARLVARPSNSVTLVLQNRGGLVHTLEIALEDKAIILHEPVLPERAGAIAFETPSSPGEYEFFCPEHRNHGMEGVLVVVEDEPRRTSDAY